MNKTAHNSMLIAQSIKNHINPLKNEKNIFNHNINRRTRFLQ